MFDAKNNEVKKILREHGSKATPCRIELFSVLQKSATPLSVPQMMEKLHGHANQTTVYRALEALAETGAVLRVDLGHAHAHYEVARKKDHHHHIICKSCGKIEDIEVCGPRELESTVLKKSKKFSIIKSHALEFFGVCNICVKK